MIKKTYNWFRAHPDVIFVTLIIVGWILFYSIIKTIGSGFHLTDDHEIFEIRNAIEERTFIVAFQNYLHADIFVGRFRPFYYFVRFIESGVFAGNSASWSLFVGFLGISTSILFYLFARRLKFNILESLIFITIISFGRQTEVWWRLGPNETIATFLIALPLFLATINTKKNLTTLNNVVIVLSIILASLSKESYLLMMPAVLALVLLVRWSRGVNFKKLLHSNLIVVIPVLFFFVIEIVYIKFFMHMGGLSYAGIEGGTPLTNYLSVAKNIFYHGFFIFTLTKILFLIIVLGSKNITIFKKNIFALLKDALVPLLIFLLIIVPQVILYAKSGMIAGRYYLPATIGLGYAVIFLLKFIRDRKMQYGIYLTSIAFVLYALFFSIKEAIHFGKIYFNETSELTYVLGQVKKADPDDVVLVITNGPADTNEWNISIATHLNEIKNPETLILYDQISNSGIDNKESSDRIDQWCKNYGNCLGDFIGDKAKIKYILSVFPANLPMTEQRSSDIIINNNITCSASDYLKISFCR